MFSFCFAVKQFTIMFADNTITTLRNLLNYSRPACIGHIQTARQTSKGQSNREWKKFQPRWDSNPGLLVQRRVNPVDNGNNTLFRGAATVLDLSHLLSMSALGRLGPLSMYTDGPSEMMSYWTEQCKTSNDCN